jgi:signal transduction histidine kinase
VLNACEATPVGDSGEIVKVQTRKDFFEIRVMDQGSGVPENIRGRVFDPFVSSGKPNGTGLGLAIVSKIVGDHGGTVKVERTSATGTVMLVKLPRVVDVVASHSDSAVV